MRHHGPVVLVPLVLFAACLANEDDSERAGSVEERGLRYGGEGSMPFEPPGLDEPAVDTIPPGPCKTACRQAMSEGCNDWEDDCRGASPDAQYVTCGEQYLTCSAAEHAVQGTLFGQTWCYRSCMGLR